jgi:hypothetical protein
MSDEDRMRAEIMSMQERADQTTDEVHGFILNYCIDEYFFTNSSHSAAVLSP